MVVTLTRATLAARMRLGRETEELNEADHLLAYVSQAVVRFAPNAPDAVHDNAAWELAGYLYDRPFAGVGGRYSNAMRYSGAASTLLPYREHGGGGLDPGATYEETGMLLQEAPFTVTRSAQNLAATYRSAGRYRAEVAEFSDYGILYASSPQPPATDAGYFRVGLSSLSYPLGFDFTVGGNAPPTWVKVPDLVPPQVVTATLAIARYAS